MFMTSTSSPPTPLRLEEAMPSTPSTPPTFRLAEAARFKPSMLQRTSTILAMPIHLCLEPCGGILRLEQCNGLQVAVLPRFLWRPTHPTDHLQEKLVYQCAGALTCAVEVGGIAGRAFDFPDLVAVCCRYIILDVGPILILMPPSRLRSTLLESTPEILAFQGRPGTTFVQTPTSFPFDITTRYHGGWEYPRLKRGWTMEEVEREILLLQLDKMGEEDGQDTPGTYTGSPGNISPYIL
ncbi:hypothetical protein DFH06DRAFT_1337527 [Mycena polygramma]|nr:hypothetical protein DFH06DRAFT_1337527 [Mycena polygramma]